jgi:hypothetical protein
MNLAAALALAGMLPAALGATPAPGRSLLVPVCSGDGSTRMVPVPLDRPALPGSDPSGCCVKGCHASSSRKRSGAPAGRTA